MPTRVHWVPKCYVSLNLVIREQAGVAHELRIDQWLGSQKQLLELYQSGGLFKASVAFFLARILVVNFLEQVIGRLAGR